MYRKLALTSLAFNVAFVMVTLFGFLPWFMNFAKDMKIEMPMAIVWLIWVQQFTTNPQCIVPTLAILLVGFFALKALRKRAQEAA